MLDCEWCLLGWFLLQIVRIWGEVCECQKRQNVLFNVIVERVKPRNLVEDCQNSTHLQQVYNCDFALKGNFCMKELRKVCDLVSKVTRRNIFTSQPSRKYVAKRNPGLFKRKFWFKKRLALRLAGLSFSRIPALF